MNYGQLKFCDMLDGEGIRVTLFVSGCSNNCSGCHNPETHDPCFGEKFTENTLKTIVDELSKPWYKGFTLCGGDPLYPSNRESVKDIVLTLKAIFGESKDIWMYTGYTLSEIESFKDNAVNDILNNIDVLLEGRYIKSLHSPDKHWVGSSNQHVFKVQHTPNGNKYVEFED